MASDSKVKKIKMLFNVAEELSVADSEESSFGIESDCKVSNPQFKALCKKVHRSLNWMPMAKPGSRDVTNRSLQSKERLDMAAQVLKAKPRVKSCTR